MRLSMLLCALICSACSQHPVDPANSGQALISMAGLSGSWQRTVSQDDGQVMAITLMQFNDGTYRLERVQTSAANVAVAEPSAGGEPSSGIEPSAGGEPSAGIEPSARGKPSAGTERSVELGLWGVSGSILFHTFQGHLDGDGQFVPVRRDDPARFNAYSIERISDAALLLKHVASDHTEAFERSEQAGLLVFTP